jgi:hypothetical protein
MKQTACLIQIGLPFSSPMTVRSRDICMDSQLKNKKDIRVAGEFRFISIFFGSFRMISLEPLVCITSILFSIDTGAAKLVLLMTAQQ